MEQRIFHGNITPADVAHALFAAFNQGNLRAQIIGSGDKVAVQVGTRPGAQSGGQTALTIQVDKVKDGVMVQIGKQAWMGVAASLGQSALATLMNPWNLLGRLDDIAQDIENLQLSEKAWSIIERTARAHAAGHTLSERLTRLACEYCETANPVGEPNCIACGAPMGNVQPSTCTKCGFVVKNGETKCPNCGAQLR